MKQYLRILAFAGMLSMVIFLTGCGDSTTSPNTLSVTLSSDKTVYRIGENVVLTVWASADCYLTLYDTDATGVTTPIFPNSMASDNLLTGGQTYRIPAESDTFDFVVTGPAGTERIRAVVVAAANANQQVENSITVQVVR